jgi:hypothetical protein
LLLWLAACQHRQVNGTGSEGGSDPAFTNVYKSGDSDFIRTVREVVRDSTRWQAVWDSASQRRRDQSFPLPRVDFDRDMLILAASPRGGPGDSVVIGPVRESGKMLQVRVTAYSHCNPGRARTHPVHIVRVRRSERQPVFDNKVVQGFNCVP